jgi:hypothetical protein
MSAERRNPGFRGACSNGCFGAREIGSSVPKLLYMATATSMAQAWQPR